MTKPMPKIAGLVEKASPEVLASAQKMPRLTGEFEKTDVLPEGSADQARRQNAAIIIPLSKLRRSPYQNRKLDEAHVADLSVIIGTDGLTQPITVRHLPEEDVYEIIAGEHRFEACKMLGYEAIPAFLKDTNDVGAARSLIFDNIHHKKLADYEVYIGFKTLKEMDRNTSIRTLASDTGWSKTQVQRILSFEKLPDRVHEILMDDPDLIGGNAAEALSQHMGKGNDEFVIEAIELIKDGRLTQARASAWIESKVKPRQKPASRVLAKPNGKEFCEISRKGKVLNLKLANGIDVSDIEQKLYDFLKQQLEADEGAQE